MKIIQFGAGRIGRSFIGQLFSLGGWEVVFIDIDSVIIDELNRRGQYKVEVRDKENRTIVVKNVSGVHAQELDKVKKEIVDADLISTAVGKAAIASIIRPIAEGIKKRRKLNPSRPIDIIICENMKDSALFFKKALAGYLPEDFPLDEWVGLVETSIGKMVPLIKNEARKKDPLMVYAEAYNTLIVDKQGFKGKIPDIPGIEAKENMKAWVDRKLYIHNMGHAVLGYTSFIFYPDYKYVWEAVSDPELYRVTRGAMWEAARALISEYPDEFTESSIGKDIDDLLSRFGNRALGDTIYRVGIDLYRKLGPDDRLIGAIRLCLKHGISVDFICLGVASAIFFRAVDENGKMFESDILFHEREVSKGIDHVLRNICKIREAEAINIIKSYYIEIAQGIRDIKKILEKYP